jgi:hypothetical protein
VSILFASLGQTKVFFVFQTHKTKSLAALLAQHGLNSGTVLAVDGENTMLLERF